VVSITITVFIPTFNRASRLNKSLSDLIHLIYSENLTDQFKILVGNNASIDTTKEIIFKASEKAKE
jgi:glycosyltransferase involved in cell wall biosynthesis